MRSGIGSKRIGMVCSGLLAATVSLPALAQAPAQALLDNKFVFSLGGFAVGTDVKARLDGSSTTNPDINFDETFGKDSDATRVRLDALWRITPAHQLRLMYFDKSSTQSRVIDRDIKWGDYTFNVGGLVESERSFKTTALAYEWAFMRRPSYEVAASFGVHYTDLSLSLSGNATLTDANGNPIGTAVSTVKQSSLPAPLPVIGIRGGWVLAPQWYLDADARIFGLNIDGYKGNWWDLGVNATWMFHPNFGVGAGYNNFRTKVDVNRDNFNGHLQFGYSGLRLFLTGTF
jgi:hypothetical protein